MPTLTEHNGLRLGTCIFMTQRHRCIIPYMPHVKSLITLTYAFLTHLLEMSFELNN